MSYFAAVQMCSGDDLEANCAEAQRLVREAAAAGARVVALPETFTFIGSKKNDAFKLSSQSEPIQALAELARELGIYLLAGSFHERIPHQDKVYNSALLFGPSGEQLSQYRKIHLFDIDAPNVQLKESDEFAFGDAAQQDVIETPHGKLAVSICYDLRFPELYRRLALAGAQVIFVPAAFTLQTGKEHWEVLLRARAIENEVYIVAPNQWGQHNAQRQSYGNSMIVDPWGKVLARASDKAGFVLAEIDLDYQAQLRRNLPCLQHRRL